MTGLLLSLVISAAAEPERSLVDIFIDACVKGELRLAQGHGEIIGRLDLPSRLRWLRTGHEAKARTTYVRIDAPAPAYLVVRKFDDPARYGHQDECILASDGVEFLPAIRQLSSLLSAGLDASPGSLMTMVWQISVPQYRYRVRAWRSGSYTVMATAILDEAEAAKEAEAQRRTLSSPKKKRVWKEPPQAR
ncbi:MAG TPA: hypothetical protein VGW34_15550 [Allosphingosinicella sp.]|nr:hypothetical protein [Allosphingosinicella sp.]